MQFDFRLFFNQFKGVLLPQVFVYGGVGPLTSDITVAGVAKAFGVHMVYFVCCPDLLTGVNDSSTSEKY